MKNLDFLELIGTPKGASSLAVTTYLDGSAAQTLTFDANKPTDKARIRGSCQYFSVGVAGNDDFSLAGIRVYCRKGREVPVGSGGAVAAALPSPTGGLPLTDVYRGYETVAENAVSVTITNANATGAYIPVVVPSWNTQVWESAHLEGSFTFTFSTPAPAGASVRWMLTPAA
jgi:hypothetical protein